MKAVERGLTEHLLLKELSKRLTVKEEELLARVEKLLNTIKEKEKEIATLSAKLASLKMKESLKIEDRESYKLIYAVLENVQPNQLREMADNIKNQYGSVVILLISKDTEKQK